MPPAVIEKKPRSDECLYVRRFKAADKNGRYVARPRYHAHLTADRLWLTKKLCIPLSAIRSLEMIRKRGLPNQNALSLVFLDPGSKQLDVVYLCDMNLLGFYPVDQLQELSRKIEDLLAESGASSQLDETAASRLPQQEGLLSVLLNSVMGTFGSDDQIRKRIYIDFQKGIASEHNVTCATAEEAREQLCQLASEGAANLNLEQLDTSMDRLVRSIRLVNGWRLFWLFMPVVVTACWLFPAWSSGAVLRTMFMAGVGILLLFLIGSFLMILLVRPFAWFCNRFLGADIKVTKGRNMSPYGRE